ITLAALKTASAKAALALRWPTLWHPFSELESSSAVIRDLLLVLPHPLAVLGLAFRGHPEPGLDLPPGHAILGIRLHAQHGYDARCELLLHPKKVFGLLLLLQQLESFGPLEIPVIFFPVLPAWSGPGCVHFGVFPELVDIQGHCPGGAGLDFTCPIGLQFFSA